MTVNRRNTCPLACGAQRHFFTQITGLKQDNQLDSATTPLIFASPTVTWASRPWRLFPPAQCFVVNHKKVELFRSEFTCLLLSLGKGRSWLFCLVQLYIYVFVPTAAPFWSVYSFNLTLPDCLNHRWIQICLEVSVSFSRLSPSLLLLSVGNTGSL